MSEGMLLGLWPQGFSWEQKISCRNPQGAWRQDELIGAKPSVVKLTMSLTLTLTVWCHCCQIPKKQHVQWNMYTCCLETLHILLVAHQLKWEKTLLGLYCNCVKTIDQRKVMTRKTHFTALYGTRTGMIHEVTAILQASAPKGWS
jgi:hypothetical protein